MTDTVESIVARWLQGPDVQWHDEVHELLAWARPYGDDLERAWKECRRPDYLIAIAGARQQPLLGVVAFAVEIAGEALAASTVQSRVARAALDRARQGSRGELFRPEQLDESNQVIMALDQEVLEQGAAFEEIRARTDEANPLVLEGMRACAGPLSLGVRAEGRGLSASDLRAFTKKTLKLPIVQGAQRNHKKAFVHLASGHALTATTEAFVAATSKDLHDKMIVEVLRRGEDALLDPLAVPGLRAALEMGTRESTRVYCAAAKVADVSANVFGAMKAANTFEDVVGMMTHYLAAHAIGDPAGPDPTRIPALPFEELHRVRESKHAEYAQRLKKLVPFSDVDASDDAGGPASPSGGVGPPSEAFAMVKAILEGPGSVDRRALAPVLRTLHERMAANFEYAARHSKGQLRMWMVKSAAAARASADRVEALVPRKGSESLD